MAPEAHALLLRASRWLVLFHTLLYGTLGLPNIRDIAVIAFNFVYARGLKGGLLSFALRRKVEIFCAGRKRCY